MTEGLVGILLAAGYSKRFGGDKLLQPLEDGVPIGVASGRNLQAAVEHGVAVVHSGAEELSSLLKGIGFSIVVNQRAAEGMGSSIACGVSATPHASGWLIALADMPYIPAAIVQRVADAILDGAAIVAPSYGNERGHPVGFANEFFAQLTLLKGDRGARSLIEQHVAQLTLIDVGDPSVLVDIDLASDIKR